MGAIFQHAQRKFVPRSLQSLPELGCMSSGFYFNHSREVGMNLAKKNLEVLTRTVCLLLCCGRPDGNKKAYVRLTADYDALDIANKIGII